MTTGNDNYKKELIALNLVHTSSFDEDSFYKEKPYRVPSVWTGSERKKWMVALFLGAASLYTSRTLMPVAAVYISNDLHWSRATTGAVLGAFFWGYTMTQFLGGYMSDMHGGERVVTAAAYAWGSITLLFPLLPFLTSDPYWLTFAFISCRVMLGLCQGFHFPSVGSLMASKVSVKERSFTFCFQGSGSHFGTLICGSIGSLVLDGLGWRPAFILAGLTGIIWSTVTKFILMRKRRLLSTVITLESSPRHHNHSPLHNHHKSVTNHNKSNVSNASSIPSKPSKEPIPWCLLLSSPAFWAMLVAHYMHGNAFSVLLNWMPTYFHDTFQDAKGWVFNVVPWIVTIPGVLCSGLLADKMIKVGFSTTATRKWMTTLALFGTAIFLVLISYSDSYLQALTYMSLSLFFSGFHNGGVMLNPQDIAPNHGGSIFGVMNMAGAIPGFLGVYIAGYMLEVTKSWAVVFNQTAALCFIGWIVYTVFGTAKQII